MSVFFVVASNISLIAGIVLLAKVAKAGSYRDAATAMRYFGAALIAAAIVLFIVDCLAIVPAGHVGVVDVFGSVNSEPLKPGLNFVNPFAKVVKMSVRTQALHETTPVPSKEGLAVDTDVTMQGHLSPDKVVEMYKTVGPDYMAVLIEPEFRSGWRDATASFEAKALYTADRTQVASTATKFVDERLAPRGWATEAILPRKITLPAKVADAIEAKLQAEQQAQAMQFILAKEQQEAERKKIEAGGIKEFQKIVTEGITPTLLEWKGIEATEKLAASSNAKIVIIGNPANGLPLILGGLEQGRGPQP